MCLAIPQKVIKVNGNTALIENGSTVKLGKDLKLKKGDFVQVVGNIIVDRIEQKEGKKIQNLFQKLFQNHETNLS